jgi:hypothetical protein
MEVVVEMVVEMVVDYSLTLALAQAHTLKIICTSLS